METQNQPPPVRKTTPPNPYCNDIYFCLDTSPIVGFFMSSGDLLFNCDPIFLLFPKSILKKLQRFNFNLVLFRGQRPSPHAAQPQRTAAPNCPVAHCSFCRCPALLASSSSVLMCVLLVLPLSSNIIKARPTALRPSLSPRPRPFVYDGGTVSELYRAPSL
jgi:hypothetical protein